MAPTNFLIILLSLNTLYPNKIATILDNWNNAKDKPTSKRSKTIFVEYCISPKHTAIIKIANKSFLKRGLYLVLNNIASRTENTNPEKHHKIKHSEGDEIKIIFFKTAASAPVRNKALNLRIMSFRLNRESLNPPLTVSKINQLPQIINNTPKIALILGISPSIINPNKSPTRHLYEFIGPNTDNSPNWSAFTKQIVPDVHKNPAKRT